MADFFSSTLSQLQKTIDKNLGIEEEQAKEAMGVYMPWASARYMGNMCCGYVEHQNTLHMKLSFASNSFFVFLFQRFFH
jgi:hypothetical protein